MRICGVGSIIFYYQHLRRGHQKSVSAIVAQRLKAACRAIRRRSGWDNETLLIVAHACTPDEPGRYRSCDERGRSWGWTAASAGRFNCQRRHGKRSVIAAGSDKRMNGERGACGMMARKFRTEREPRGRSAPQEQPSRPVSGDNCGSGLISRWRCIPASKRLPVRPRRYAV